MSEARLSEARLSEARSSESRTTGRWVLAATILGSGMAFIDGSVVAVALPSLQRALHADAGAMQWVVNGYTLMLGALILLGGAAGDRFGRRRVFMAGIALFALASLACGAAPNAPTLILARAVQGVGGALMVPQSLALIAASFPGPARGPAVGTWAAAAALTTVIGPALGGWLVQAASWRAIFLINPPLAAATLWLTWRHVPESRNPQAAPLDWRGAALVTSGLAALTWGAIAIARPGMAAFALILLGLALLAAFVAHEAHARAPMVPLGLFRSPVFSGVNIATLLLYAGLSGTLFFLPFALIRLRGLSSAEAGAAFLPLTLLLAGLSRFTGALARRTGPRLPLVAGPAIAGVGFAWLGFGVSPGIAYVAGVLPAMVVLGIGMAVTIPPLTTAMLDAVADRLSGTASGINNAVARVAGLLAVAILGSAALPLQSHLLAQRLDSQGVAASLRLAVAQSPAGYAEITLPPGIPPADAAMVATAVKAAFQDSFAAIGLVCAGLAAAAALCAALTIPPGTRRPPPDAVAQAALSASDAS